MGRKISLGRMVVDIRKFNLVCNFFMHAILIVELALQIRNVHSHYSISFFCDKLLKLENN
jgi:hypothetical protein